MNRPRAAARGRSRSVQFKDPPARYLRNPECTAACPKGIPLDVISQLNKDLRTAIKHGH